MGEKIVVEVNVKINPLDAWEVWTNPNHIVNWNFATEDWRCPFAQNTLIEGGSFSYRMEAKDKSSGFYYVGKYKKIDKPSILEFILEDGRNVKVEFIPDGENTIVKEEFEAEKDTPVEIQKEGWQSILNNYKKYTEGLTEIYI